MKKLLWTIVIISIASFIIWSTDPLDQTMNFIIGGAIPGTKIVLGFWPTLMIITGLIAFIIRAFKNAHLTMMEEVTKQSKTETAKAEFKQQHSGEGVFDRRNRSVIAAPNTD